MFIYPKFVSGKQVITRVYDKTSKMMQNITVYRLKKDEEIVLIEPGMESAYLILSGNVTVFYKDKSVTMARKSVFEEPTCLHLPKDVSTIIKANEDSEILVQSTENDKSLLHDFSQKMMYINLCCEEDGKIRQLEML